MARTTYLGAVNQVLRRLRRGAVASVANSTYSSLIGELVNEAKREVEDAWNWTELRAVTTITTDTSNQTYRLTGMNDRYRIQEVWNNTLDCRVRAASDARIERDAFAGSLPAGAPDYWRISGLSAGDPLLEFNRVPDAVYDIRVVAIVPQADLSSDAAELLVPHWPVVLGAYKLAIGERGEDGGIAFDFAQAQYQSALSDAIANDNVNKAKGTTSDWYVE